jgi:hypothetical protein
MSINELELEYERVSHEFECLAKNESNTVLRKDLVHKNKTDNVFVKDLKIIASTESYDSVVAMLHIPIDHYYFFEHPKDHIPGLMLIDAGKQAGTAMCHKIYNVDFRQIFILDDITVRFIRLTTLDSPLFLYSHITGKKYRKDNQLSSLQAEGYFYQCNSKVAYMRSSWKIIAPEIFNRIKFK